jgi:hypothetical protein
MQKLILTTAILAIVAASPAFSPALARGGHGRSMHGHSMHRDALRAPSAPAVPPSLPPDARFTGSAPLASRRQLKEADTSSPEQRNPEDVRLDQKIKSICHGC